jgi:SSS family solute:Na+ symporter
MPSFAVLSLALPSHQLTVLSPIDVVVLVLYFVLVLFIGFYVKGATKTSEEFFLAGREMTAWIAGLSFVSANLGSLELMGWAGAAYQYGILATHWYWIGAIPAMLFLGIVMMPFYVNMYAMAVVMQTVLGWNITFSIWVGAVTVAIYVMLGGLRSAIINEVLQFVLIWAGAALIPILGLIEAGGWTNLKAQIAVNVQSNTYTHLWSTLGTFKGNPMGIHWTGIVFGLGMVISFGYWTTDFLVVQRVLSANNLRAAKMAPIIGAAFKMAVPLIVIVPGLLALAVLKNPDGSIMHLVPAEVAKTTGQHAYDQVLPLMLIRYCGPGLLGLGITALVAGFMSGMAGNVSAFSTVWTYDLYGAYVNKKASDSHYVLMGRMSTVVGMLLAIATAYLVANAASIMDYVQALFSFFIAPLFGTVILGMLWKRATSAGGFLGLLAGTVSSIGMWIYTSFGTVEHKAAALARIALSRDAQPMAENMYRALWSWLICIGVTVIVSYMTKPKSDSELNGLVYGATVIPHDGAITLWQKPIFWAIVVSVVFFILNIIFW